MMTPRQAAAADVAQKLLTYVCLRVAVEAVRGPLSKLLPALDEDEPTSCPSG